jgi:hypothetical protein
LIDTREELFASTAAANVISREFAERLHKSTKNQTLKGLLDKGKATVIITASLRAELFTQFETKKQSIASARLGRKTKGGRPRLPDPDNPENLTGEALVRYKNRMWQRRSRYNRGLTSQK